MRQHTLCREVELRRAPRQDKCHVNRLLRNYCRAKFAPTVIGSYSSYGPARPRSFDK